MHHILPVAEELTPATTTPLVHSRRCEGGSGLKVQPLCQQYTDTATTPVLALVGLEQTLKCRQVLIPLSEDDFWRPQIQDI